MTEEGAREALAVLRTMQADLPAIRKTLDETGRDLKETSRMAEPIASRRAHPGEENRDAN